MGASVPPAVDGLDVNVGAPPKLNEGAVVVAVAEVLSLDGAVVAVPPKLNDGVVVVVVPAAVFGGIDAVAPILGALVSPKLNDGAVAVADDAGVGIFDDAVFAVSAAPKLNEGAVAELTTALFCDVAAGLSADATVALAVCSFFSGVTDDRFFMTLSAISLMESLVG